MNLSEDVDLEQYVSRPDQISAADIASICQEAGMKAVRKNRYVITQQDFDKAYKTVVRRTQKDYNFYKWFVSTIFAVRLIILSFLAVLWFLLEVDLPLLAYLIWK